MRRANVRRVKVTVTLFPDVTTGSFTSEFVGFTALHQWFRFATSVLNLWVRAWQTQRYSRLGLNRDARWDFESLQSVNRVNRVSHVISTIILTFQQNNCCYYLTSATSIVSASLMKIPGVTEAHNSLRASLVGAFNSSFSTWHINTVRPADAPKSFTGVPPGGRLVAKANLKLREVN